MEKVLELLQSSRTEGEYHYGHVDGEENLEVLLEKFRQVSGMYFPTKGRTSRSTDKSSHFSEIRPLFSLKGKGGKGVSIDFNGMPFTVESNTEKMCMFGKDTKAKAKQKAKDSIVVSQPNEHGYHAISVVKRKPRHQVSKKNDCPSVS